MKFSIVTPVYNVSSYLRAALDSVLAQTNADFELICVDDGSTDGSGEILDAYANRDERIVVVHTSNRGVGCARNIALECVRGDYIVFFDSDDLLAVNFLAEISVILKKTNPDVLRYRATHFNDEPRFFESNSFACRAFEDYESIFQNCIIPELMMGDVLCVVRRSLITDTRFKTDMKVMEDCIFMSTLMAKASKVVVSRFAGYGYRCRHSSASLYYCVNSPVLTISRYLEELISWIDWYESRCLNHARSMRGELRCVTGNWIRTAVHFHTKVRDFRDYEILRIAIRKAWAVGLVNYCAFPIFWLPALYVYLEIGMFFPLLLLSKMIQLAVRFRDGVRR